MIVRGVVAEKVGQVYMAYFQLVPMVSETVNLGLYLCCPIVSVSDHGLSLLTHCLDVHGSFWLQAFLLSKRLSELWIKDNEPVAGSTDYGKDEDMAEVSA